MAKKKAKPGPKVVGCPSRAVAFRIPTDLLDRLDAAASAKFLSRNKMVELTLRDNLPKRIKREIDDEQPSLFD